MASLWLLVAVLTVPHTEARNGPHAQDGGPRMVKRKRDGQGETSTAKPTLMLSSQIRTCCRVQGVQLSFKG